MKSLLLSLLTLFLLACSNDQPPQNVGNISFDPSIDDEAFELCNDIYVKEYYVRYSQDEAPTYKGEKWALDKVIMDNYTYPIDKEANGYITIRFIVNCKGEMGRFRTQTMDLNYQPMEFDNVITEQLLEAIRKLDGWIPRKEGDQPIDFYQYLSFKMKDGQIIHILP
jgi:hypothetical protein